MSSRGKGKWLLRTEALMYPELWGPLGGIVLTSYPKRSSLESIWGRNQRHMLERTVCSVWLWFLSCLPLMLPQPRAFSLQPHRAQPSPPIPSVASYQGSGCRDLLILRRNQPHFIWKTKSPWPQFSRMLPKLHTFWEKNPGSYTLSLNLPVGGSFYINEFYAVFSSIWEPCLALGNLAARFPKAAIKMCILLPFLIMPGCCHMVIMNSHLFLKISLGVWWKCIGQKNTGKWEFGL